MYFYDDYWHLVSKEREEIIDMFREVKDILDIQDDEIKILKFKIELLETTKEALNVRKKGRSKVKGRANRKAKRPRRTSTRRN